VQKRKPEVTYWSGIIEARASITRRMSIGGPPASPKLIGMFREFVVNDFGKAGRAKGASGRLFHGSRFLDFFE
jgi:hypothetical protein